MSEIKVSVIVPVYNGEMYIRECIESILAQSLKEIELICVDDGSTDGTVKILEEIAQKDQRLKILKQQNKYAGVARNLGMANAKGEYLVFLDADDFFHKNMMENMYNQCKKDNAQICVCDGYTYDENAKAFYEVDYFLRQKDVPSVRPFSIEDIPDKIFNFTVSAPWNKMFQREFVEEKGLQYQDTRRANDLYFCNMALALAERITVVNERLVNYRRGHGTSLQAMKHNDPLDFYYAMLKLKDGLRKAKLFGQLEKSFVNFCLGGCLYNLNTAKTGESYSIIYETLKNEAFNELKIASHSAGFYYVKKNYEKMQKIMAEKPEIAVYNQLKQLENENESLKKGVITDSEAFAHIPLDGDIKVSVIIPVYNVEKYLIECVESVTDQSLKNIEIICVNDGSTDNSLNILKELKAKDNRIQIIDKVNGGLSSARNAGMETARGEYILFLDSDDYLDTDTLKALYLYAKNYDLDELFYNASVFYDTDSVKEEHGHYSEYYKRSGYYPNTEIGRNLFIKFVENKDFRPSACLQILRRDFLKENQIKFYEGILHEDNLFTMQCISLAKRTRLLDIDFYKRRVRGGSIVTNEKGFRNAYGKFITVLEMQKFIEEHHLMDYFGFYIELMNQLAILCDSASMDLKNIGEEEIFDYIATLPVEQRNSYMLLIYHIGEIRERVRNRIEENAGREKRELRKQLEIAQEQCERLKTQVSKKNEDIAKLKEKCKNQNSGILRKIWRKLKKILK